MAIFVNEHTKVIVQGLTGGQGKYHGLRNKAYGTQVVGGVTPGKGGTDVEGVPVFNTVAEAVAATAEVVRRGQEAIEADRRRMQVELRAEVARLVVETTAKVLDQTLDDAAKARVNEAAAKSLAR